MDNALAQRDSGCEWEKEVEKLWKQANWYNATKSVIRRA